MPATELVDARVPVADVLGRRASLAELAAGGPAPDPLAEAAMRSGDLSDLARQAGYSPRHLRRRLLAAAGLGPKRLQRIGRMQRALSAGRGESWARTAVEHGWRAFGLEAEDVPAALARAVAAGAEPEQEAVVKPWGQTVAYVRDPNGTLIEPGSPVAG